MREAMQRQLGRQNWQGRWRGRKRRMKGLGGREGGREGEREEGAGWACGPQEWAAKLAVGVSASSLRNGGGGHLGVDCKGVPRARWACGAAAVWNAVRNVPGEHALASLPLPPQSLCPWTIP